MFYHGTSDKLSIRKIIYPPIITNNKREQWRTKYDDKVFFTTSLKSALKYAKKACEKFGGNPIVYEVRPIGFYNNKVNNEYIADKALIKKTIKI